jgi:hypothetical protein
MRKGVVGFIDALGWKGIWKRADVKDNPKVVIDKLKGMRMGLDHKSKKLDEWITTTKEPTTSSLTAGMRSALLSDSIVLAFEVNVDPKMSQASGVSEFALIVAMCEEIALLTRVGALAPPPIAYRGAIAYGDYDIEDNFIIGPAVDEAAESMGKAEAAMVWLTPSARRYGAIFDFAGVQKIPLPMMMYPVPMKGGAAYETLVAVPFEKTDNASERGALIDAIAATFDHTPSLEVEIKKQNTVRFLRAAADRFWSIPKAVAAPADQKPTPG